MGSLGNYKCLVQSLVRVYRVLVARYYEGREVGLWAEVCTYISFGSMHSILMRLT